jgi:hypothetical protein
MGSAKAYFGKFETVVLPVGVHVITLVRSPLKKIGKHEDCGDV